MNFLIRNLKSCKVMKTKGMPVQNVVLKSML
nr:MAG TPA: hypothetical protein [Crassvirales sp.]